MAGTVKYITKRGSVFYYERRVPRELRALFGGKALFRRSLRTRKQAEAIEAYPLADQEFRALANRRRASQQVRPIDAPPQSGRPITEADLAGIREQFQRLTFEPFRRQFVLAELDPEAREELERMREERELFAAEWRGVFLTPGAKSLPHIESAADEARWVARQRGLDAADPEAFAAIVAAVRAGRLAGQADIDRLLEQGIMPAAPAAATPRNQGNKITLREAVRGYLDDKQLVPKTAREVEQALAAFEKLVGNKPLDALTRGDFQRFLKDLGGRTVGGKSDGSITRPTSAATVGKKLGFLRSAINHALDRGDFEGQNPASGHNIDVWVKPQDKSKMPDKRPFTVGELNKVFAYPWFVGCKSKTKIHEPGKVRLEGAYYWAPIVALFTGCRASELGGLMLTEVDLDGPHPHFRIRHNQYRRIKSGYSRSVPILDALRELGFDVYVGRLRAAGEDRLFPDWTSPRVTGKFDKDDAAWSNAGIIRAFNRTLIPSVLKDSLVPGARREVTFHGFRGAFKSMLGRREWGLNPNTINEVVGHKKPEMDNRYIGTIPIEELYPDIRACRYVDLEIPRLPWVSAGQ